jgi:cation/acetate symporter
MKRSISALVAGSLLAISFAVFAGPGAIEGVEKQPINVSAIAMFMIFVIATREQVKALEEVQSSEV